MTVTEHEIESFHQFVLRKIAGGVTSSSLEDCLRQWRAERDRAETIEAVNRGIDDMEAGRYLTLDEMDKGMRQEFGFTQR